MLNKTKKTSQQCCKVIILVSYKVGVDGFEPPTLCL